MEKQYSDSEKDAILRNAFLKLKTRGIESPWANSATPFVALRNECAEILNDPEFSVELRTYLRAHSIISRAIEMFYTHIAMAARARWDQVPEHMRPITARGWFLGRWIPTFLIIDGPIGRFIFHESSPLFSRIGPDRPMLSSAREFLNSKLFRQLRNGFAHWGFDWEIVGKDSYVIAYDWEKDLPIAKLHQEEADAFHIISFAIIEVLDGVFELSKGSR